MLYSSKTDPEPHGAIGAEVSWDRNLEINMKPGTFPPLPIIKETK